MNIQYIVRLACLSKYISNMYFFLNLVYSIFCMLNKISKYCTVFYQCHFNHIYLIHFTVHISVFLEYILYIWKIKLHSTSVA
jgi:hypothetical protein